MANIHTICITIFTLLLLQQTIYQLFYSSTNPNRVRIKAPKFSLLGPYNTSTIYTKDNYNKLIDIKRFSFIKRPDPCSKYPAGILLMVIVSSNPINYENRMIIRNTWGKSVESTKVVFLIGETHNSTTRQQIHKEHDMYGDIVQGTFIDAYRNMTYKHVMGLKWVAHHCPTAKYVLKTDDDVVVHIREMRRFLAKELSPWGARSLIACQALEHAPAQRKDSKWKVTTAEYGQYYYPTYCAGWAVLYSQDVIPRLLEAAQEAPYFWIDDVHITGFMAQKIGVTRTPINSLILSKAWVHIVQNLGSQFNGNFLFGPPDLRCNQMTEIWKAIPK